MFKQNIKKIRLEMNLSQTEFAKLLGRTQSAISDWENGRSEAGIDDLIQIAIKCDIDLNFLLGLSDEWGNTLPNANATTNALTEDEKEIIGMYRRITPREQQKVRIALEMYANTEDAIRRKGLY